MSAPLDRVAILEQRPTEDDLLRVAPQLRDAFVAIRAAVAEFRPVIVVVDDRDLLGQRGVCDAAVATGLLGLARAFSVEGAKEGWSVNVVSHRGQEDDLRRTLDWVAQGPGLTGQLIRIGAEQIGKVSP